MGTMSPAGVDRAARFGAAWYAAPGAVLEELTPLADRYRAACAGFGTAPRVMVRRDVLVLADGDRARRLGADAIAAGYRGMTDRQLIVGDKASAVEQLMPFAECGVDQVVVRTMGIDPAVDLETIENLADVRTMVSR
jgi:alkanesulfonate monooxygenase SsuD/methylene tetrahydromethanopterin reductase-like flavin-dependent oxidoreductase (luciferase family)